MPASRALPTNAASQASESTAAPEPAAKVAEVAEDIKSDAASPVVKSATRRIVAGFLAILGCLVVLGVLAATIREKGLNDLDATATPFLHGFASPTLDAFMNEATFVGSDNVLAVLFVIALIWLIRLGRPRREWLFLAVALGGSLILNETMKLVFQRPRPTLPYAILLPDLHQLSERPLDELVRVLCGHRTVDLGDPRPLRGGGRSPWPFRR